MSDIRASAPFHWPEVEPFTLHSDHLEANLRISLVHLQGNAAHSLVIYLLDPSFNFPVAVSVTAFLGAFSQLAGGAWPSVTIAVIGYETDDPRQIMADRARDLTPTDAGAPTGVPLPPLRFGGAPAFLAALRHEVLSVVEKRIKPSARVLVGHSFGGLFGVYALLHSPEMFNAYLLVSPSLWWDDRVAFRYERAFGDTHRSLPAKVFFAVGEKEQATGGGWRNEGMPDEAIAKLRQVDNLRELAAAIEARRYEGLQLETAPCQMSSTSPSFPLRSRAGCAGSQRRPDLMSVRFLWRRRTGSGRLPVSATGSFLKGRRAAAMLIGSCNHKGYETRGGLTCSEAAARLYRQSANSSHPISQKSATPTTGFKGSRHRPTAARRDPFSKTVARGFAALADIRCRPYVRCSISRNGAVDPLLP